MSIEWPWQYNFPPFFTLQPHIETQNRQIAAWKKLILDYFAKNKMFILDVQEALNSPLFNNIKINRKLDEKFLLQILDELSLKDQARPTNQSKTEWHIFWRSEEEWAVVLYDFITENGLTNTVCTIFEIQFSEDFQADFQILPTDILLKILKRLSDEDKCVLIFEDRLPTGVKFL